jgi:hypothetical protein
MEQWAHVDSTELLKVLVKVKVQKLLSHIKVALP